MHVKYHIVKFFVFNLQCCPAHPRHNESIPVSPFMSKVFITFGSSWAIHYIFFFSEFLQLGRENNLLINHSHCIIVWASDHSLDEEQ